MTQPTTAAPLAEVRVRITQEILPPYDASHGTPNPVAQRLFTFEFPEGVAEVDQTDYGHPGRFNPCHLRRIPLSLQPRTGQILAAAEALAKVI